MPWWVTLYSTIQTVGTCAMVGDPVQYHTNSVGTCAMVGDPVQYHTNSVGICHGG